MKTLLVGINAKYIHTNFALRYFKSLCKKKYDIEVDVLEFTTNHNIELILDEILVQKPDVVAFSCYIWNIDYVSRLCNNIKMINKDIIVVLGGPEVSFLPYPSFDYDYIISGEGEISLPEFISNLSKNIHPQNKVIEGVVLDNLDALPFPYDFYAEDLSNRILYYEASRGCPENCAYCLSSASKSLRFKSIERIKEELQIFLKMRVKQVKFTDRTFNADKGFFIDIISFIRDNTNNITNFHFEINAEKLDDDCIKLIETLPKGLVQFEIGVQSTNTDTLKAINRKSDTTKLFENTMKIQKGENIHLHLDLIAGLPLEGIESFKKSFNEVYSCEPNKLQLGFLKLLKGSALNKVKDEHSIVVRDYAPYEVLSTKYLSFEELVILKRVEEMVEHYYNSGRYRTMIKAMVKIYPTPFDFYLALAESYYEKNYHLVPPGQIARYDFLYKFASGKSSQLRLVLPKLCRFDMHCHNPPNKLPLWALDSKVISRESLQNLTKNKGFIREHLPAFEGLDPKEIIRSISVEIFEYEMLTGKADGVERMAVFDYNNRDIDGMARVLWVDLD